MAGTEAGSSDAQEASVAGMMKNLNLTAEEEEVLAFSDGEEEDSPPVERALLGKVLSPAAVHATAIHSAMKPAGLKIRSIGLKGDNLFVAQFKFKKDMERALNGSPWVVGKHVVLMQEYDECLKPSEIKFDKMDIWVRLLDLPLGWMNKNRGGESNGVNS
jgi:hypothetical protein